MNWKRTRSCSPIKITLLIETNRRGRLKKENLDPIWRNLIQSEYIREIIQQVDKNVSKIDKDSQELSDYITEARENLTSSYTRWIKNIKEFESSDVQEIYLTTNPHV